MAKFRNIREANEKVYFEQIFHLGSFPGTLTRLLMTLFKEAQSKCFKKSYENSFQMVLESLSNSKAKRYTLHSTSSAILKLRISGNNFQLKMIFCVPDSRDGLFELSRNVEEV